MTKLPTASPRAPLPVLRAAVFAVVGTVLGASAHHLVAEGPVLWRQSAVAIAVLFAVGLAGTRRPRSLATVMVTSAVAQGGLHLWLSAAHAHRATTIAMPGHMLHGTDAHSAWHERVHDSVAMTAVHAAAAVLVAVLLHRADAACWSLARGLTVAVDAVRARIARAWALMSDRPMPTGSRLPTLALERMERPPPEGAALADVVVRRGPPRAGLVLAI
ncbi:hypothetical protein H1V43_23540 [Streptomyces sp. PSKA54]|uniref:Uncharacterized protein n=1 Tax=Streptomyces himalayensis subsp. aureolus TaxID=2758039 RepID=A0A7W2D3U7_9ACTN|nr:hypothetical protein [Streptomyces himalayensis]MBA4864274.1 hypothetical protein [Streptomyces himalayensis subsp. aureolus]